MATRPKTAVPPPDLPRIGMAEYIRDRSEYLTALEAAARLDVQPRQVRNLRDKIGGIYVEGIAPGQLTLVFPRSRVEGFQKRKPGRESLKSKGK